MADEAKNTNEPEVKEAPVENNESAKPEEKVETIGEVMQTAEAPKEESKPETVGLDKFLDEKKGRREAEKKLKDLQKLIEEGGTDKEIASDIDSIAAEGNVDKKWLKKFTAAIQKQTEDALEGKVAAKLRPLEEKERQEKINSAFNTHFKRAMENMPEYESLVNPSVIKTLSLDPSNSNKSFQQLIEETYGNAIGGKRTLESTTPRGGNDPQTLDFERANKDPEYFDRVMANPKLKAEYNNLGLRKWLS